MLHEDMISELGEIFSFYLCFGGAKETKIRWPQIVYKYVQILLIFFSFRKNEPCGIIWNSYFLHFMPDLFSFWQNFLLQNSHYLEKIIFLDSSKFKCNILFDPKGISIFNFSISYNFKYFISFRKRTFFSWTFPASIVWPCPEDLTLS